MIPHFPNFKKLTLDHKNEIESYVKKYPHYSDYNFTSLWTYNTEESIEICFLNNNLVIKFIDYITNKPFYSFLGTTNVINTIEQLFIYAQKNKIDQRLKLIPEIVIQTNEHINQNFIVMEDLNNHDYIVSAKEIAFLPKEKFHRKRYLVEKFKRKYPDYKVVLMDLRKERDQKEIFSLFFLWEKMADRDRSDTKNELIAIKRLISSIHHFNIFALGIYHNNKLIAFNIYEISHNKHGVSAFQKADKSYTGIYSILSHEVAKHLYSLGCEYINYEQDLGIEGLRLSKSLWKPTHYLKKYIISPK